MKVKVGRIKSLFQLQGRIENFKWSPKLQDTIEFPQQGYKLYNTLYKLHSFQFEQIEDFTLGLLLCDIQDLVGTAKTLVLYDTYS